MYTSISDQIPVKHVNFLFDGLDCAHYDLLVGKNENLKWVTLQNSNSIKDTEVISDHEKSSSAIEIPKGTVCFNDSSNSNLKSQSIATTNPKSRFHQTKSTASETNPPSDVITDTDIKNGLKPERSTSILWEYFRVHRKHKWAGQDYDCYRNNAMCILCKEWVNRNSASTSHLEAHLKSFHKPEFEIFNLKSSKLSEKIAPVSITKSYLALPTYFLLLSV